MTRQTSAAIALIACLAIVPSSFGFTFNDITQWIGTGANESALLIDFNDGSADPVRVWGYRYDGSPNAYDMLIDIVTADPYLYTKVDSQTAFGPALFGLGYDADTDGFGFIGFGAFDANGINDLNIDNAVTDSGPAEASKADGGVATDADDQYAEGWWSSGFWLHYTANDSPFDGSDTWASAFGLNTQVLADGAWTGLSFDNVFDFDEPPSNPVPEPASLALMLLGGAALLRRKR